MLDMISNADGKIEKDDLLEVFSVSMVRNTESP